MKNNTLAMLGTIALVGALASMIGYIDPATCTVEGSEAFMTCEEAAGRQMWAFWGFLGFAALTLGGGTLRYWLAKRRTKVASKQD